MIPFLFNILFFVIPLIFFKNTSELFEFNKVIVLYSFTALIVSAWIIQSIRQRRMLFRRTLLDLPLLSYLATLLLSTLFSIDPRTSWLGYYSRFNGGLLSQVCYALLYWAYVSNLDERQSLSTIYHVLTSTAIAAAMAAAEHFGIFTTCGIMGLGYKESCWVQDVQTRVFSTLGQPNWVAALIVAIIPISWTYALSKNRYSIFIILYSIFLFVTLLFTKSRSGLLAFGVEFLIFWAFVLWQSKFKFLREFAIQLLVISLLSFVILFKPTTNDQQPTTAVSPVLETGGTESGTIRKYVWLGAIEVFKHHPILGTGPETFAFSFPMYKPVGHNLTSEWDFVYNKAHNDFLNTLANTGLIGFVSYISLIFCSLYIIWYSKKFEYLAGYVAILITNFFGFSVVPVSLLTFLFPAIALLQSSDYQIHLNHAKLKIYEKILIFLVLLTTFYLLHTTYSYWKADIYYNKARSLNRSGNKQEALIKINKALKFSPSEPVYIYEKAISDESVETAYQALQLSKYNQNLRKILINNLVKNADKNSANLLLAEEVILDGIKISPNDPKLYYQLGILRLKINKIEESIQSLTKATELKPNYKEARFALGSIFIDTGDKEKAKAELEYILKNIDPNDELTKKYLEQTL